MVLALYTALLAYFAVQSLAVSDLPLPVSAKMNMAVDARLHSTHLFDRIAEAEWEIPRDKWSPPAENGSSQFQPFWFTRAAPPYAPLHRRVVLGYPRESLRDMRDGVILPIPSAVSLPILAKEGGTLVFTVEFLNVSPKAGAMARLRCLASDGKERVFWEQPAENLAGPPKDPWPAEVSVGMPTGCTRLIFETTTPSGKLLGGMVVWQGPRLEREFTPDEAQGFNILFVVVDAMRADVVGVNNTAFPSVSPAIDALEAGSAWFPRAYANSNTTLYSMNTMLLGMHPSAWGAFALWQGGKDRRPDFYALEPPFLPHTLHSAGYVTFGATHNHLYFPGYKWGVDPGFDVLQDCGRDVGDHPILVKRALAFMERNRHRRFFVQVNLIAPHQPYNPPADCLAVARKALRGRNLIIDERYVGEVCWVDRHVGLLVKGLEELGLQKETVIVLTADHGEVMDHQHDCYSAKAKRKCIQLHGNTLFDEEIRVPLIFSLPGVVPAGPVSFPGEHVDIAPTLLELLGLPSDERFTGDSLLPALLGKPVESMAPFTFAEKPSVRAWQVGDYKLIAHDASDDVCPRSASLVCKKKQKWFELYNTAADPAEHVELSRESAGTVVEMKAAMGSFRTQIAGRLKMAGRTASQPDEARSSLSTAKPPSAAVVTPAIGADEKSCVGCPRDLRIPSDAPHGGPAP